MTIGRMCIREVDLAEIEEPVWEAAERMHQRNVGALVVLNREKKPIGILTDRDLVVRVLGVKLDPLTTQVGEVMTKTPRTVTESTSIQDALAVMRTGAFRRLPVVDSAGALAGMVTLDDVLLLICEEFAHVRGVLERESPRMATEV